MSGKKQVESLEGTLYEMRLHLPSCSWAESCHDTLSHFPDRPQCKLGPLSRDHSECIQLHRDQRHKQSSEEVPGQATLSCAAGAVHLGSGIPVLLCARQRSWRVQPEVAIWW